MNRFTILGALASFVLAQTGNINEYGPPEYGHGLTERDVMRGFVSLFDGKTTLGWKDAKVVNGELVGGTTTMSFRGAVIGIEFSKPGFVTINNEKYGDGTSTFLGVNSPNGTVTIKDGAAVKSIKLLPTSQVTGRIFNGTDFTDWRPVHHPKLAEDRRPKWTVKDGFIHALGGPGALEYTKEHFGDGVIQIEVRTRSQHSNGGLFFRCVPGQMMNGYEAQIYNKCEKGDVSQPSKWSTGAIDDRQNARRLVSRDGETFVMTVIANGPHLATWVNGYQQVDWTDTRAKDENPRKGLRIEPGPIQLQAHDPATDIEFRSIRMAKWGK